MKTVILMKWTTAIGYVLCLGLPRANAGHEGVDHIHEASHVCDCQCKEVWGSEDDFGQGNSLVVGNKELGSTTSDMVDCNTKIGKKKVFVV